METAKGPTHISQVAMVVHDLDASMKMLHDTLGWGPWNVYEHVPPKLHDTHLRGKPVAFSMLGAECEVQPGLVVELVQPLDGPSIYKEWLEEHGEGVQHIACMMHSQSDSDAFKQRMGGPGSEGADGWPNRRDDRVLLPRHRADAQVRPRIRERSRHRPDSEPDLPAELTDSPRISWNAISTGSTGRRPPTASRSGPVPAVEGEALRILVIGDPYCPSAAFQEAFRRLAGRHEVTFGTSSTNPNGCRAPRRKPASRSTWEARTRSWPRSMGTMSWSSRARR